MGNPSEDWCSHLEMRYWLPSEGKTKATCSLPHPENECLWSINDFWSYILCNLHGDWLVTSINPLIAIFTGKNNSDMLNPPAKKSASLEHQQFVLIHLG
jgi:hypothetical protein